MRFPPSVGLLGRSAMSNQSMEALKQFHNELAKLLAADEASSNLSWDNYVSARNKFTLDGDEKHWLGCSLYTVCRMSQSPNTENPESTIESNCVSLTKLVRLCNISLAEFFDKTEKWINMMMPDEFRNVISRLKSNFSVSILLFQKFQPIFKRIFQSPDLEATKSTNKLKKKSSLCSLNSFFEFCWCLFICAKNKFPDQSDDLVVMYHVLLSCIDCMFANAYMGLRKDLINPKFEGLPDNWLNTKTKPKDTPCIVELLCKMFSGHQVDAKALKQYNWKPMLKKFFDKEILSGDSETFTGLLDIGSFDSNLKSLNKIYGKHMLKVGDFDERIFLGNIASEIGANVNSDEITEALTRFAKEMHFVPETPLSGRKHLKQSELDTPITAVSQSVARFYCLLTGRSNSPSKELKAILNQCNESLHDYIVNLEKALAAKFLASYATIIPEKIVEGRLYHAQALYYWLLEQILKDELKKKSAINLQGLLTQDELHQALFACACEIVIYHHNQHQVRFPWILQCLQLKPFYFYKVIEPVVLAIKEKLSRDDIKHLNSIEEQVLESLVWTSDSPLWDKIKALDGTIPQWNEVCIQENNNLTSVTQNVDNLQSSSGVASRSPISSVSDCFLSPLPEVPRRQLFMDGSIRAGRSLLNQNITSQKTNDVLSPDTEMRVIKVSTPQKRPIKGGSFGLFLRKFYSLAAIKMQFLCTNLKLNDQELKQKIWTCFEQTIIKQTHLMQNRHLDQILMCTIYAICKVSTDENNQTERKFTEIMRCYRMQPQASNEVYRSVLVRSNTNNENQGNLNERSNKEERIDLIEFYNQFYVPCCRSIVNGFSKTQPREDYKLCPIPERNSHNVSTGVMYRMTENNHICIKLLINHVEPQSKSQSSYCFSRSQTKDLHEINTVINKETNKLVSGRKRSLPLTKDEVECKKTAQVDNGDENETEDTN